PAPPGRRPERPRPATGDGDGDRASLGRPTVDVRHERAHHRRPQPTDNARARARSRRSPDRGVPMSGPSVDENRRHTPNARPAKPDAGP
ncbi:hypothetical protein ABZ504_40965, partial [Streptomyces mirabilis]